MADDRISQLKFRAQQANRKYALLREGVEPEITDVLGVVRWRPQRLAAKRGEAGADNPIPFHVPMTRAHRLATAAGVTSFHFAHSFINKVSTERMEDGRRNRPGAARAHGKYVERETAVANLTDAVDPAIAASSSIERAVTADASPDAPSLTVDHEENKREREEEDRSAAGRTGGRSEGTDAGRPVLQRYLEILGDFASGDDADPVPICVSCPASNWYVIDDTLNCWCKELHKYPWTPGRSLPLCDSRGPARKAMLARARQ